MQLILGAGISGKAAIKYLKDVCFFDDNIKKIENIPNFESWVNIESVIISPGIPLKHYMIQEALARNIPINNDIGLFLDRNPKGSKIGITGTNGKSTTCAILQHVIGERSFIGGNFGISPLEMPFNNENSVYIIEVSSYQLEILKNEQLKNFDIGVITNISPNHINRHGSYEDYVAAKCKILNAKNKILGPSDFFKSWDIPQENIEIVYPKSNIFKTKEYKAAWIIVYKILLALGENIEDALKKAQSFEPLEHRQEIVTKQPVLIINDSKACNPISSKQAISNLKPNICWIAGGLGDGSWDTFSKKEWNKITKAFLINKNESLIAALQKNDVPYLHSKSLSDATKKAITLARSQGCSVLFSPGHPSQDKFKNFEERGKAFKKIAKKYF